tara:strand:- start:194 stop:580 length:387 start_codon:yes stop_codon:yes gene_type:complete
MYLDLNSSSYTGLMIVYVDIDSVICHCDGKRGTHDEKGVVLDYASALPYMERIEHINGLHDKGDVIVYWTARGTDTDDDWMLLTYNQLEKWGCKYHQLKSGKPVYDLLIDDNSVGPNGYFGGVSWLSP